MSVELHPAMIVLYEGRVWDVDADAHETFTRKARCVVTEVHEHTIVVRLADYPREPYEYLIEGADIERIERVSA